MTPTEREASRNGASQGAPRGPSAQHPLMGARLSVLLRAFVRRGGVAPRHAPLFGLMVLSALGRAPVRLLDQIRRAQLARAAPAMEAPVFVIGHWRSGTTHLHNLLGRNPAFGHISPLASGLPDEILTLGTWLAPLLEQALPEDRHVDRVAVRPDSPQEDEIPLANLQGLSVFHAVYFPKRFQELFDRGVFFDGCTEAEVARWARLARAFAEKIALHQSRPLLIIKNPVYTARIALLRQIWPQARFVYISRDPYEVFASTRSYYRKLLAELALQDYRHLDIDHFVLSTYTRLLDAYTHQRAALAPNQLMEVRYDELCRAPLDVLEDIHHRLDLPDWSQAKRAVEAYLPSIADYQTNRDRVTPEDRAVVDAAWGRRVA